MTGVKGRSGRKEEPDAMRSFIIVRLTEEEKGALKSTAEKSSGGNISSLVREKLINDRNEKEPEK